MIRCSMDSRIEKLDRLRLQLRYHEAESARIHQEVRVLITAMEAEGDPSVKITNRIIEFVRSLRSSRAA